MGIASGMPIAVGMGDWSGCGAAGCAGCFFWRGLSSLTEGGGAQIWPPKVSFKALTKEARTSAASRGDSRRPGSGFCARYLEPPRPSPGTMMRAWNLPVTKPTPQKPALIHAVLNKLEHNTAKISARAAASSTERLQPRLAACIIFTFPLNYLHFEKGE